MLGAFKGRPRATLEIYEARKIFWLLKAGKPYKVIEKNYSYR
ncbi:hypothetical protein FTV88_0387 [Heliorestis convoluta]|uniref:Uncharacterized protein n=1 Tax=Heliorestis convoluta TaxID=356322 RepID=A0A5Q2MZE7_9FIRM|nr:hypothetical protein FTV88_0387 [Heliorestis convoluta]